MKSRKRTGTGLEEGLTAQSADEHRRILSEMAMLEIRSIGKVLIAKAKKGDVIAVRELLDRAFGKAPQTAKIDLSHDRPLEIHFDKSLEHLFEKTA